MFFNMQTEKEKEAYVKFLKTVGSLSNLFSESPTPYLYYRIAEKVFCKSFNAEDLSRGDVATEFFFDFVSKVRRSCVQFPAVCLILAPLPLPYSRNNTPTAPFLQVLSSLCAAA